eukprot:TRINITY_DN33044_c0_g1_i3.p1 TRINITY_DN33044_c0_g1~~TRINITY_DN33044_c0_g1_i3.p1  ORF type:complete len:520 (+),score=154.00 TRINITY_DN33044_c0_g1_i3:642-2201(+)
MAEPMMQRSCRIPAVTTISERRLFLRAAACCWVCVKTWEQVHLSAAHLLRAAAEVLSQLPASERSADVQSAFRQFSEEDLRTCEWKVIADADFRWGETLGLWQCTEFWLHMYSCARQPDRVGLSPSWQCMDAGALHEDGTLGCSELLSSNLSVKQVLGLPLDQLLAAFPVLEQDCDFDFMRDNWDADSRDLTCRGIVQRLHAAGVFARPRRTTAAVMRRQAASVVWHYLENPQLLAQLPLSNTAGDTAAVGACVAAAGVAALGHLHAGAALCVAAGVLLRPPAMFKPWMCRLANQLGESHPAAAPLRMVAQLPLADPPACSSELWLKKVAADPTRLLPQVPRPGTASTARSTGTKRSRASAMDVDTTPRAKKEKAQKNPRAGPSQGAPGQAVVLAPRPASGWGPAPAGGPAHGCTLLDVPGIAECPPANLHRAHQVQQQQHWPEAADLPPARALPSRDLGLTKPAHQDSTDPAPRPGSAAHQAMSLRPSATRRRVFRRRSLRGSASTGVSMPSALSENY